METNAKQIIQCDSCRAILDPKLDPEKLNIQAVLNNSKGESQKFHYCSENCLLAHLKERDKRRKAREAKASLNVLEVDFFEKN